MNKCCRNAKMIFQMSNMTKKLSWIVININFIFQVINCPKVSNKIIDMNKVKKIDNFLSFSPNLIHNIGSFDNFDIWNKYQLKYSVKTIIFSHSNILMVEPFFQS